MRKTFICLVLVFCICASSASCVKVEDVTDRVQNDIVSVSSENFEVNNGMLQYFFNSQYLSIVSTLEQVGVDTTKNLREQKYTSDKSWFDYLMQDMTIPQVKNHLVLCEAAKADGFELDDSEREEIDELIDIIKQHAKDQGVSIDHQYGYGVTIDDIRDALEIAQLSSAYSEHLVESYDFDEEDLDALEENYDVIVDLEAAYKIKGQAGLK